MPAQSCALRPFAQKEEKKSPPMAGKHFLSDSSCSAAFAFIHRGALLCAAKQGSLRPKGAICLLWKPVLRYNECERSVAFAM